MAFAKTLITPTPLPITVVQMPNVFISTEIDTTQCLNGYLTLWTAAWSPANIADFQWPPTFVIQSLSKTGQWEDASILIFPMSQGNLNIAGNLNVGDTTFGWIGAGDSAELANGWVFANLQADVTQGNFMKLAQTSGVTATLEDAAYFGFAGPWTVRYWAMARYYNLPIYGSRRIRFVVRATGGKRGAVNMQATDVTTPGGTNYAAFKGEVILNTSIT